MKLPHSEENMIIMLKAVSIQYSQAPVLFRDRRTDGRADCRT